MPHLLFCAPSALPPARLALPPSHRDCIGGRQKSVVNMGVGLAAMCGWLLGSSLACISCRRADASTCNRFALRLQPIFKEWVRGEVELVGFAGSDVVARIGVEGSRSAKRSVSGGKGNCYCRVRSEGVKVSMLGGGGGEPLLEMEESSKGGDGSVV